MTAAGADQQVVRFTGDPELRDRMIFLPEDDISMARHIYAGVRRGSIILFARWRRAERRG